MVGLLTMGFHTAPCHPAARTVGGGQAGNGKTLYKYVGDLVGFFCFVLICLQGVFSEYYSILSTKVML